jgi:outer membrane receptor protein involved in Fe transport
MSYEAGAALGGPVIQDVLGLRVSGWYRSDGGYVDRIDPITGSLVDHNVNRLLSKSARVALTWAPSGSVRVTPALTYESYSLRDVSAFLVNVSDPRIGQLRNESLTRQPENDTFYLANLKLTAGFRFADFSAVTSYFDRSAVAALDSTPADPPSYADAASFNIDIVQTVYSQDVRLTSVNPQAALSWVAGAFYSNTHTRETSEIDHTQGLPENPRATDMHGTQVEAFAQGSFKLGRRLTGTAGLRLGRASYDGVTELPPLIRVGTRETWVTPKFDLSYQAGADHLLYLSVAKGYRSGSIEPAAAIGCDSPDLLPSNTVWSYEIGAKNELLGARAHVEASIFHIQWTDNEPDMSYYSNCGIGGPGSTAVSDGFELAAQALVTQRLRTAVALAYTDAHYTQTVVVGGAVIFRSGDAIGGLPQVASPWNVTSSIDYQFPLISDVTAELRAEDIFHSRNPGPFSSDNPASPEFNPALRPGPSTNLLNLRATARWPHFDLGLFVNNALDSQPTLSLTPLATGSARLYAATFRPRTVGLTANWRY